MIVFAWLGSAFSWFLTSPAGQAVGAWLVKTFEDEIASWVKKHQERAAAQGVATAFDQLGSANTSQEKADAAKSLAGAVAHFPPKS